jgi:hypothetical protein
MADIVLQKSIAELIDDKALSSSLSWTAGGASDSATWTGTTVDRQGFATGSLPRSLDAVVFYDATLASGKTLSIQWDLQDSPDGTNFSDFATEASAVVATGPSGGGRVVGVARLVSPSIVTSPDKPAGTPGVPLGPARRYVRLLVIPHLSATGTDTAVIAAVGVFAGFDTLASPLT